MSMTAVPVMALVRVQVPDGIDPGLVEAEVTRSICLQDETPMSAEVIALPARGTNRTVGQGRHEFVALLSAAQDTEADVLARVAQKALRKGIRRRFGTDTSAKLRAGLSGPELAAGWQSVRGEPVELWAGPDIVDS